MLSDIIDATVWVLTLAIIARSLLSWFPNINPRNPIVEFLMTITEPVLAPIRSVMPRMGMFDLTPIVAIILLRVVGGIVSQAVS